MNEIRKTRNRKLFIDTACKIIEEEGIEAATARNIAGQAGYNPATLYLYFDNLSQLIVCAHMRFEDDMFQIMKKELSVETQSYAQIWPLMYVVMAHYYLAHPNAFECSYLYKNEKGTEEKIRTYRKEKSVFQEFAIESLKHISKELDRPLPEILAIHRSCIAMLTGVLLLIIRGRFEEDSEFLITQMEMDIRKLM